MTGMRRRDLLTGTVLLLANGQLAKGEVISGQLPWHPGATAAPEPAKPGNWSFLTGARYDYTDWVGRHNERYPLPPVSIAGRDEWNSRSR